MPILIQNLSMTDFNDHNNDENINESLIRDAMSDSRA